MAGLFSLPAPPASSLLFIGGILAAIRGSSVSAQMEIIIPLYDYPYEYPDPMEYPNGRPSEMWVSVKDAAEAGHPITGILNPFNGPNISEEGGLGDYRRMVNNFLNKGDDAEDPDNDYLSALTIICYVSTNYGLENEDNDGFRSQAHVEADILAYETLFPGVCEGIFFDEASADITDEDNQLTDNGDLYKGYYDFARGEGKTVTFNPGGAADPAYYDFSDDSDDPNSSKPTMMSYENFYSIMRNVGLPRALSSADPSKNAIVVHTTKEDLDNETDPDGTAILVRAIVQNLECAGWGKVYLTSDDFSPNPWDNLTNYWATLVEEVYDPPVEAPPCPNPANPQMTLMVPLFTADSTEELDAIVEDMASVVSRSDYLEGGPVSVILDGATQQAVELRDAGARVLCYFNYEDYEYSWQLNNDVYLPFVSQVCGGFYVDNFDFALPDQNFFDLYFSVQNSLPRSMLVLKPADGTVSAGSLNVYTKDWSEANFRDGPVVVATVFDASSSTTPLDLPLPDTTAGAERLNSALIVTGFTETDPETVECLLNEIDESYGYAYLTAATDPAGNSPITSFLARLLAEIENPTATEETCNTPTPTTPACGEEDAATYWWNNSARKIVVKNGGCADMTRISAYLEEEGITPRPLLQVEPGVWELDATIEVKAGSVVKIMGEAATTTDGDGVDGIGECNELRLLTDATSGKRTRVFGNTGSITIQNTKIVGWKDDNVDDVESNKRGFIYCSSCPTNAPNDQCIMSVVDAEIGYLGSNGVNTGGLAWRDRCDDPAEATAQSLTITGNRRGIYAYGAKLNFGDLQIGASIKEGIRVDTCSGSITGSTVEQDNTVWGIHVQRPDGLEVADNTIRGSKSLYMGNPGASRPTVTGNTILTPSLTSVRVRTTNTLYSGNTGDGKCESCSRTGLRAQSAGCFSEDSGSDDQDVQAYINQKSCI